MSTYFAPVRDMTFVMRELIDLNGIASLPGYDSATPDVVEAVIREAGTFAEEVLSPLNATGDRQGSGLVGGRVEVPEGFADAYRQFVDGGWNGMSFPEEYGGQGLPQLVSTAVQEIWQAANMAFALCPLLTMGAIEALLAHGSEAQRARFLPRLVTGEWSATMNLTEPQAGSDLSGIRTRAERDGDTYRLFGQKIFITWGEHEVAENIVHMVLARTPDAPEGVKGISLFVVPKYLVNDDGSLGHRNDLRCVSLEHKLGIHASPTCTMAYGDNDGAVGYLVGEEGQGLAYMFTMMNEARLKVGLQGLAISDRAYQQALSYARERIQGRPLGKRSGERVSIIRHPDVRRMLMSMKSQVEAMRAFSYVVAESMDIARRAPDGSARASHQARVDLLIPIVKAWCTELAMEVTSLGVQVHGGMGFIEETGAAQHLRDARITSIYEGTTGIQAMDLVGRKMRRDGGAAMGALLGDMRSVQVRLAQMDGQAWQDMSAVMLCAIDALTAATEWLLAKGAEDPAAVAAQAVNYLMLTGYVCGGWQMARSALVAARVEKGSADRSFYEAKVVTAQFYMEQILPKASALARTVRTGGGSTLALDEDQF